MFNPFLPTNNTALIVHDETGNVTCTSQNKQECTNEKMVLQLYRLGSLRGNKIRCSVNAGSMLHGRIPANSCEIWKEKI